MSYEHNENIYDIGRSTIFHCDQIFFLPASTLKLPRADSKILLESLENRRLLAVITWNGNAGDDLWTTDDNWDLGRVPGPADEAIIPGATGTTSIAVNGNPFGPLTVGSIESDVPIVHESGMFEVLGDSILHQGFTMRGSRFFPQGPGWTTAS